MLKHSPICKAKLNCKQKTFPKGKFWEPMEPMTRPVTAGGIMCFVWCLRSMGALWPVALGSCLTLPSKALAAEDTSAPLSQPSLGSWGGRSQPVPCHPGPPAEGGYHYGLTCKHKCPKNPLKCLYIIRKMSWTTVCKSQVFLQTARRYFKVAELSWHKGVIYT